MKRARSYSTGQLALIFVCSVVVAGVASVGISARLARGFVDGLKEREINLIFGAIEAGPLALARLQAGAIAQSELSRLMEAPGRLDRLILSARIAGGEKREYEYAAWRSRLSADPFCGRALERPFSFPDALHPFWVSLELNQCARLSEETEIFRSATVAAAVVCLLVALSIAIAAAPVLGAFRSASRLIHGDSGSVEEVRFLPLRELVRMALRSRALEREAALTQLATQVAHDIRSPLSVLQAALGGAEIPGEASALVRGAVTSIREIADSLLKKNREHSVPASSSPEVGAIPSGPEAPLAALVEKAVGQKQAQLRDRPGVEIRLRQNEGAYPLFAALRPIELERVLSNLMNNAAEAITERGCITVSLEAGGGGVAVCEVRDDGRGIPADVLPRLARRGVSIGKVGGSGLGLAHARETVESWGGRFAIESALGEGTVVRLGIPTVPSPAWLVPCVEIGAGDQVVIVDGDEAIRELWGRRLAAAGVAAGRLHHARSPDEGVAWFRANLGAAALYLCDHELRGHAESGLALIERLGIARQAILVTDRFDDEAVRSRCGKFGIPLLPKSLIGIVPVRA